MNAKMVFVLCSILLLILCTVNNLPAQDITIEPDMVDFGEIIVDSYGSPAANRTITIHNNTDSTFQFQLPYFEPEEAPLPDDNVPIFELLLPQYAEARAAIYEIVSAINRFRKEKDEEPSSVEELLVLQYLILSDSILEQWTFTLIGSPYQQIEAISTHLMPYGAGHGVFYSEEWNRDYFFGQWRSPLSIPPHESFQIVLSFLPPDSGSYRQQVEIAGGSITAQGSCYYEDILVCEPERINFGYTHLDSVNQLSFTLKNPGFHLCTYEFTLSNTTLFSIHSYNVEPVYAAIKTIFDACLNFTHDHNSYPAGVEDLIETGYVDISPEILDEWEFIFIYRPITHIQATSTEHYRNEGRRVITYDGYTKHYSGYGNNPVIKLDFDSEALVYVRFYPVREGSFNGFINITARGDRRYARPYSDIQTIYLHADAVLSADEEPLASFPAQVTLSPAYPNPFNSSTTIEYRVGANSNSPTLSLYDLSGRLVQTLVNERLTPGNYRTTVNAGGLSSGVYFVKLNNDYVNSVRSLQIIK